MKSLCVWRILSQTASFFDCRLCTDTELLDKNISPPLVDSPPTSISATALRDLTSLDPSCDPPAQYFMLMDGSYL